MAKPTPRIFDARPDRLDLRDLPYRPPLRSLPPACPADVDVAKFIPSYVAQGLVLDQGRQGACTGFGLACVANYLFWVRHVAAGTRTPFLPVSPRMLYELARRYDEWPGTDYEGSSCRGALKGWHKHGVCSAPVWPYKLSREGQALFVRPEAGWELDAARRPLGVYYRVDKASIVDLQSAILDIGAIYVSASAHDGWDTLSGAAAASTVPRRHADLPDIPPVTKTSSLGGHAFALVGYNERGFVVQNSWGTSWGASGFAVLPYGDWIVHATDAWACALGVPSLVRDGRTSASRPLASSPWRMKRGGSLSELGRRSLQEGNPPDDPWPVDRPFAHAEYRPWSTAAAYEHSLVTGNDGRLVQTDFTRDPADGDGLARQIVRDAPRLWLEASGGMTLKLAVYAHGGLNSEEDAIQRNRVLGPCFEANGIYPLFLAWKTGPAETIADMVQDWTARVVGDEAARSRGLLETLGEAKDRAVEALAHVLGKGLWTEMRGNAGAGAAPGHGLDLLVRHLADLRDELEAAHRRLDLHVVGHSAGSIVLGHLLTRAGMLASPLRVRTGTLWAPACSAAFANRHYVDADRARVLALATLFLHVLSDQNEKADGLPTPALPAYGKSLLYMVSRALDDVRKQPLLGMERAQLPQYATDADQWDASQLPEVAAWQAAWPGAAAHLLHVVKEPDVRTTRTGQREPATHGSFDNNIEVVTATLERIRGSALVAPLEWLDY